MWKKKFDEARNYNRMYEEKLIKLEQKYKSLLETRQNGYISHDYKPNENDNLTEHKEKGKNPNILLKDRNPSKLYNQERIIQLERELLKYKNKCKEAEEMKSRTNKHAEEVINLLSRKDININTIKDSIESCIQHIMLENGDIESQMSISYSPLPNQLAQIDENKTESLEEDLE